MMELFQNKEKTAEYRRRAQELVAQMTLEEKVMQTVHQSPEIKRLGIKAYNWWNEALHGVRARAQRRCFHRRSEWRLCLMRI